MLQEDGLTLKSRLPFIRLTNYQERVLGEVIWEWTVLVSPFFFWGTAMVAMKEVLPKAGPFFVSLFRLVPAGLLLVAFAAYRGRKFPSGFNAWLSICVFAVVDATCFQGFLAQGLQRTSAGLASVCHLYNIASSQCGMCGAVSCTNNSEQVL